MVDYDKLEYKPVKSHIKQNQGHLFLIEEKISFNHDEEKQLAEIRKITGETRMEFLKRMIANGVKVEIERLKERQGNIVCFK